MNLVKNHRAFTLLEVTLVMLIISLAVGLVAPRMFGGSGSVMLLGQVRQVVAALRYAKRLAIIQGRPIAVVLREASSGKGDHRHSPPGDSVNWLRSGVSLRLDKSVDMEEGKGLNVVFFPEGGSIGAEFILMYKGRGRHLSVNPVNGRITVSPLKGHSP